VAPERKELKALLEVLDFRVPKGVKDFKDNQEILALLEGVLPVRKEQMEHKDSKVLLDLRVHRMLDSRKM